METNKKYTYAFNGMGRDNENNSEILNAHISYKGRSVIIDYEFCLHDYGELKNHRNEFVPFEMYPYNDYGIHTGFVNVDKKFHKADMEELIKTLDEALAEEPSADDFDINHFFNEDDYDI